MSLCRQVRNPYKAGSLNIEAQIFDTDGRFMGEFPQNDEPHGLSDACGKRIRSDPSGIMGFSVCALILTDSPDFVVICSYLADLSKLSACLCCLLPLLLPPLPCLAGHVVVYDIVANRWFISGLVSHDRTLSQTTTNASCSRCLYYFG